MTTTTTGSAATESTNPGTVSDPVIQAQLCVDGAIESLSSAAAETVIPDSTVRPNADLNLDSGTDSWRIEVAARLERYRTRRKPRSPRYPSLLLPFDAFETWSRTVPPPGSEKISSERTDGQRTDARRSDSDRIGSDTTAALRSQAGQELALSRAESSSPLSSVIGIDQPAYQNSEHQNSEAASEQSAKVIEFPRSAAIPMFHSPELADPIFDRPRIVEAPEILPPPPALGGMLIEAVQKEAPVTTNDTPAASASPGRRALAVLVDGIVLATALAAFAAIFLRLNPNVDPNDLPLPILAAALATVATLLWMAYNFSFLVYTGSTPGLRAARLRLAAFDGSPLTRASRRWRVLASFLSAFSAGLGYLWCILDQDGLCWHDRITRSNIQNC
jgi:uncharacterized RDD family membrane protein YckC